MRQERMTEPQFFPRPQELSASDIIALTQAKPRAGADLDRRVGDIAPIDRAGPGHLTFLDNAKFLPQLDATQAGICLTTERFAERAPAHVTVLATREPYRAFIMVTRALFPQALQASSFFGRAEIDPDASVHPTARLEVGVRVEVGARIGPGVEIGEGTMIGPNAIIGPQVRIGRNCAVGAGASLFHALIGDRVVIHPGARIGQDGFGYLPGRAGHLKVPQVGRVIIQDEVEIGAGSAIDRGGNRDTTIGEGTKIDNLVQIGHNVAIGRHCLIAAQVGISGSCTLGDYVMLAGQVGLADHVTIGDGVRLGGQSGVMNDIPAGERWMGTPAVLGTSFMREVIALRRLAGARPAGVRPAGDDTPPDPAQ
jgi:UDP-3-O-[3-hydroxymyristoyl] glucosamine N-acyltransferase